MPGLPWMAATRCVIRMVTGAMIITMLPFMSRARAGEDEVSRSAVSDRPAQAGPIYLHRVVMRYELGEGPRSYWLFEPAEPKPERAAVVVFFHGWFAVNPAFYGAWIDHLVRSGRTVIFPRYQNDVGTLPREFLPNAWPRSDDASTCWKPARSTSGPILSRVALIGHSAGGNLAAQIAAVAADPHSGLPQPKLVSPSCPARCSPRGSRASIEFPHPPCCSSPSARTTFWWATSADGRSSPRPAAIPRSRKRFLLFRSDRHGFPPLIAEHTAPTGVNRRLDTGEGVFRVFQMSLGEVNALDRAGFWRIADVAIETAFAGRTFDEAIRDEERFTHLGFWSDGRKVNPPLISDDLSAIPRVNFPNGIRLIPWDGTVKVNKSARIETDVRIK